MEQLIMLPITRAKSTPIRINVAIITHHIPIYDHEKNATLLCQQTSYDRTRRKLELDHLNYCIQLKMLSFETKSKLIRCQKINEQNSEETTHVW